MPSPIDEYRARAEFRASKSRAGIGAAVTRSDFDGSEHVWESIITDGTQWHYVRVIGPDLGLHPDISNEDVEQGIERLAATLPAEARLQYLLDLDPLHIDRHGNVRD